MRSFIIKNNHVLGYDPLDYAEYSVDQLRFVTETNQSSTHRYVGSITDKNLDIIYPCYSWIAGYISDNHNKPDVSIQFYIRCDGAHTIRELTLEGHYTFAIMTVKEDRFKHQDSTRVMHLINSVFAEVAAPYLTGNKGFPNELHFV